MKMLRLGSTVTLLIAPVYTHASFTTPQAPPKPAAPAAAEEQFSSEEKQKRKDWARPCTKRRA